MIIGLPCGTPVSGLMRDHPRDHSSARDDFRLSAKVMPAESARNERDSSPYPSSSGSEREESQVRLGTKAKVRTHGAYARAGKLTLAIERREALEDEAAKRERPARQLPAAPPRAT